MFTKLAIADAESRPISVERLDRRVVAVVGELGDERAGELPAVGERPAERRVAGCSRATRSASRAERGARRHRLEAPVVRGSCPGTAGRRGRSPCGRARRPRRSRRGRARRRGSGRRRCRCRSSASRRRCAPRAAPARCSASAATLASLSTNTGRPSRSAIRSPNGRSVEREVDGDHRGARALVDQAGNAEADRGDLAAGAGARTPRPRRRRCRAASTGVEPGRTALGAVVDRRGPESTAPASSFVPPMSTPMMRRRRHAVTICSSPDAVTPNLGTRPPSTRLYRSAARKRPAGAASRLAEDDELEGPARVTGAYTGGPDRRPGRRITPKRVIRRSWSIALRGLAAAVVGAVPDQRRRSSPAASRSDAQAALTSGGNMLTSTDTVLVIGTDQRPAGTHEGRAQTRPTPAAARTR